VRALLALARCLQLLYFLFLFFLVLFLSLFFLFRVLRGGVLLALSRMHACSGILQLHLASIRTLLSVILLLLLLRINVLLLVQQQRVFPEASNWELNRLAVEAVLAQPLEHFCCLVTSKYRGSDLIHT
jgi:hypothetical protein